ncbi:MAG TPA: hemerythrin domain-containing protein [Terriglobia bacterium]|jgi:hemerythrin superfamily protein
MKVTVLLRNDHETVKSLFDKFKKSNNGRMQNGKREVFNEIRREILIHSQMELEVFYPALAETSSARATELVSAAEREHHSVEKLLQELNLMNGGDKNFETKMDQLIDEVERHIEMEEEEIFDEARKNLPEYRLEELGLEMEQRRKILSTLAA